MSWGAGGGVPAWRRADGGEEGWGGSESCDCEWMYVSFSGACAHAADARVICVLAFIQEIVSHLEALLHNNILCKYKHPLYCLLCNIYCILYDITTYCPPLPLSSFEVFLRWLEFFFCFLGASDVGFRMGLGVGV